MMRPILLVMLLLSGLFATAHSNVVEAAELNEEDDVVYYQSRDVWLCFTLYKNSKEAVVGEVGHPYDNNAIFTPMDWLSNPVDRGYKNLSIPGTISYEEEEYTVVGIADKAFYRSGISGEITLPETIRFIGENAFGYCIYVESINIPSQVKTIESGTFWYCDKLKAIHLPEGINSIGNGAFQDCINLKEINIPGSCKSVGNEAFNWCKNLKKVILEDGQDTLKLGYSYEVSSIYYSPMNEDGSDARPHYRGMFADSNIDTLYLGRNISYPRKEDVSSRDCAPFEICSKWNNQIRGYWYTGPSYDKVQIGCMVTYLPDNLFMDANINNEIVLPNGLIKIGDGALSCSLNQKDLFLPYSLDSIGVNSFSYNYSNPPLLHFASIAPPDGYDCSKASVIHVPSESGSIYREKWSGVIIDPADELLTINVKTPGTLYSRLLANDMQVNRVTRLKLKGLLNDDDWNVLKSADHLYDWDLSDLALEELPEDFFRENNAIVSIKLPNTIKRIQDNQFSRCSFLTGIITIPESCTEIGNNSFEATHIEGIKNNAPISIGERAFYSCLNYKDVYITGDGTFVGKEAFWFSGAESVRIGKGVIVGEEAFSCCENLQELVFEDGVCEIGDGAFSINSNNNLKKVTFEGSVNCIGNAIFGSAYITDVNNFTIDEVQISNLDAWCLMSFPDSLSCPHHFTKRIIINGQEIDEVTIPNNVEKIGSYLFNNWQSLKSVHLNMGMTEIGEGAFLSCYNLTSIDLPSSLNIISDDAFRECYKLRSLDLAKSISSIGERAFASCFGLEKVVVHWDNPISVGENVWEVSNNCYLYVPINTASKYYNAGWDVFKNLKEAGILTVMANVGGVVSCYDANIENTTEVIFFTPYKSFYVNLIPNMGYRVQKVELNGIDVTSDVEDNKLFIEEPEEDMTLSVVFADEKITVGDVNGDGTISPSDAVMVLYHFFNVEQTDFNAKAADVNGDGTVTPADAIETLYMYFGAGSNAARQKKQEGEPQ